MFETLIRLDDRFKTLHNNMSDVLLHSIRFLSLRFRMLYKTKTGVGDCVNSYLVKIPATQAISSDVLIRCLVVRCTLNERSYFFGEVFQKSFIFNLSRRNENIWHVININICIGIILFINFTELLFLWWYHVLLAVIRHLGYSTKPKVASEKHKFEKIM